MTTTTTILLALYSFRVQYQGRAAISELTRNLKRLIDGR